jgi:predicted DNA-binding protein with PD1-like motif
VIYREGKLERALLARVERGEDLAWALGELARWEKLDAALVRGTGTLATADLAAGDGPVAHLEGPLALVSLAGTLARREGALVVALHAVLVRPGASGLETIAGRLDAATADGVDLVLDVLDDAGLEWRVDPETGGQSRVR